MAKLTLDLSGQAGLAPNFAGDLNDTTAQPQLRYLGAPGQMADGVYDPLRVQGYMSPANNVFTALTGTLTNTIVSGVYSPNSDILYLAENGLKLAQISSLNGTTITETTLLSGTSSFRDTELYQINNQEAVYYSYLDTDTSVQSTPNLTLGYLSTDSTKGAFQIASQVYESLLISETANETITTNTNQALAQTFSTGDFFSTLTHPVTGIRLRIQVPFVGTAQTWTLKVSIQTDNSGNPSGTDVTGTVVTVAASTLPVGSYEYVYFTFANAVLLSASTIYHIVVQPTSFGAITSNQGLWWLASYLGNNLYPNQTQTGQIYNGTTWLPLSYTNDSYDFALVLNQYNFVGSTTGIQQTDNGQQIGTTGNGHTASATTLTFSQVSVSLSNPCILIGILTENSSDIVTSVTVDGSAANINLKQAPANTSTASWQYLFSITGVSAGTHSIVVTTSTSTAITAVSAVYYGINQATPTGGATNINDNTQSGGRSVIINSSVAPVIPFAFVLATVGSGSVGTVSATTGTTLRVQNSSKVNMALFDSNAPSVAVSYTLGFSSTQNSFWPIIYGALQPVPVTTTTTQIPAIVEGDDTNDFVHSSPNGFVYWFTGSRVHKFDGGTTGGISGTFTPDILTFPSYIKCIDVVDTNSMGYIAIESSAYSNGDTRTFPPDTIGVYAWNYQSILSTIANYYPAPGARNIKRIFLNSQGQIRLITIGEDRFTEVRGLVNGQYQILFRLGLNAFPALRDSFAYLNNMCTWLGNDGFIYALGQANPTAKESIFKIGNSNGLKVGTYTPGVFIAGNKNSSQSQDGIFISYNDSTSGNKLVHWYPHGVGTINTIAQTANGGNVYSLALQFPTLGKVNYIRLFHAPVGTTSSTIQGTIKTYVNQSTTASRTDNVTQADIVKGYQYIKIGQALTSAVFALQFEVSWPTNVTLSTSADWMPRMVEIDYDPITKLF